MHSWRFLVMAAVALAFASAVALAPTRLAYAQAPGGEAVKVRVEITDDGFKPEVVEVPQGKLVELTFVWAHVGYVQDEHIIVLSGYKLETDVLSFHNREATFKFVADKPGSFNFKCDIDCAIHDYIQRGTLKVGPGGGGGGGATASLTPTSLELVPSSSVTAGEPVTINALLQDANRKPVAKAELRFYVDASLANVKDKMEIGVAKTDADGKATFVYHPTLAAQEHAITGSFEGMGVYEGTEANLDLMLVTVAMGLPNGRGLSTGTENLEAPLPPSVYVPAPVGLEGLRNWAPVVLAGVVLCVWAVFGFVLFQAFGISRTRAGQEPGAGGRSAYGRSRR